MKIEKVESGQVVVALTPADCLLLAHACRATSDYYHEVQNQRKNYPTAYTFDILGCLLESYTLLGDADGRVCNTGQFFDLDAIARDWDVRPGILGGAR